MNRLIGAAVTAALLAACATAPVRNDELDQAHSTVQAFSQDPDAERAAAEQLRAAQNDLAAADAAAAHHEPPAEVTHLAYLARKDAETGIARIHELRAHEQVARAETERNRILLEARTRQAEEARRRAHDAQLEAQESQRQAREFQRHSQESDRQALDAQRQAEEAQRRAQESQAAAQQASADAEAARAQMQAAQQQLADLQAKQTERGMVLTLSDVLFDTNEATLKPGAAARLDRIASFLQGNPHTHIIVEGYTDSTGTAEYNERLSQRRAHAVAEQLESRGISADRVQAVGRGQEAPVATNATQAGRQQNRRVEIIFSDTGGRFAQGAETPALR